jgi:hypothetical protein
MQHRLPVSVPTSQRSYGQIGILASTKAAMPSPFSHTQLVQLATIYQGRSCAKQGPSRDTFETREGASDWTSAKAPRPDGKFHVDTGGRMDDNGTFADASSCCLSQMCVFGVTPEACEGVSIECPSRHGDIDYRTCSHADTSNDHSDRRSVDRTIEDCCHHKRLLEGCQNDNAKQTWQVNCCQGDSETDSQYD